MKNLKVISSQSGFSVLEIILASAVFVTFATGITTIVLTTLQLNQTGNEQTIANQYASEGIEIMRSMKNESFASLTNTAGTGVAFSSGLWGLSGANNTFDKYTRVISIADVQRDGSGNIVASGGTVDSLTKKITSTVSWNASAARLNSVVFITYLANWEAPFGKGGFLVYGDGGTTSDAIKYRILDGSGNWGTAAATADVDGGSTNRALRVARVYATEARDEKVLLSRHYNGTTQYIYAQVFNGTTWGNVQLLANWNATTFLDVQNFDGAYQNNGTFLVVYSDNTSVPKMRTWNGSTWSAQVSTNNIGGIPNYIVTKARRQSNEVMAAFFDQGRDTNTQYFNGGAYTTGNWTLHSEHGNQSSDTAKRLVDFDWSIETTTTGALVYAGNNNDRSLDIKIWTANGSGSGSWSSAANTVNQANMIGAVAVKARKNVNEFIACDKDAAAIPQVICYKSNFTPAWTNPTNQTVAAATNTGIQRSFHIGVEQQTDDVAIAVYSDATNVPKLKKYTTSTSTWDLLPTAIVTTPLVPGPIAGVTIATDESGDDMMVVMSDTNNDLYTVGWDGTNNTLYTTDGRAFTAHGTNGSASTDLWYDFVFDLF